MYVCLRVSLPSSGDELVDELVILFTTHSVLAQAQIQLVVEKLFILDNASDSDS